MQIRDRIKELRRVKASELVPNAKNWRTHPDSQKNALRGILAEVGFADALLARELDDGRLVLIDGHLRAETAPEQRVPVLVLDVNEEEADKLLATLDPLAVMAGKNDALYGELISMVQTENASVQSLLDAVMESHSENLSGILVAMGTTQVDCVQGLTATDDHASDFAGGSTDSNRESPNAEMTFDNPNQKQEPFIPELFQVVVSCDDENHQRETYESLTVAGYACRLINL